MSKELQIITVMPAVKAFWWQLRVQCHNFRKHDLSDKYHVLLFIPFGERSKAEFGLIEELQKEYPEVTFHWYEDTKGHCTTAMKVFDYIPLLRPWTLLQHWNKYPELKDKAIFYTDQDVLFTEKFYFSPYLEDDISYMSWAGRLDIRYNYLNWDYFETKRSEVREDRVQAWEEIDPLEEIAKKIGISKEIIKENNERTGGAQYLLKGIDAKFWSDVFDSCCFIKQHFHKVNQFFFPGETRQEKENKGIQAWCADMWAVLWNLWKRGIVTECPKNFDFLWATDPIERLSECKIYHHAGHHEMVKDGVTHDLFNKRKLPYVMNEISPYDELEVLNNVSKDFCASFYAQSIKQSS